MGSSGVIAFSARRMMIRAVWFSCSPITASTLMHDWHLPLVRPQALRIVGNFVSFTVGGRGPGRWRLQ